MVEAEKIIIRPIISEKSYAQIDHGRYTFEVHPDAHKTHDRPGGRAALQRHGASTSSTANMPPKPKRRGMLDGAHAGLEEGRRAARARRQDRVLRGQVMGIKQIQADLARPPLHDGRHVRGHHAQPSRSARWSAPLKKNGGRNSYGRITTRHQGGGHKRRYRIIDFKRDKDGVPAKVAHIEYDPNRSARIALLHYADGEKRYILAPAGPQGRRRGRVRARPPTSSPATRCRSRTSRPARRSTTSSCSPGRGGQLVRSAGTSAQLQAKEKGYGVVRLPSGELRRIRLDLPRHGRRDRQRRPLEHHRRQGRSHPLARRAPDGARHGHEPGRPPARRRRGQDDGRPPSGDAVGRARRSATARAPSTSDRTSSSSAAASAASAGKAGGTF